AALGERLGGRILSVSVQRLDFVNDTTLVEVRFRPGSRAGGAPDIAVDGRAPVPCAEREVPGAREAVA
ncbi:DUF4956 domain-containing protein, partial [Propionibacterium freudenreichii]|nr:DUF4956 domain-containing protein [Propionibacterium freudenreichii]